MPFRGFLSPETELFFVKTSPETELFFVKTYIIHALAETTSEAYSDKCQEVGAL